MPAKTPPAATGRDRPSLAQRYQDRADYLRAMASKATDADVRTELQRMARTFEARAERSLTRPQGD